MDTISIKWNKVLFLIPFLGSLGCGAGAYGYARHYVPVSGESRYLDQVQDLSYEEVRRRPVEFQDTILGWFGVVKEVSRPRGGELMVELSFRAHQHRHLCREEASSSCRVTVSEHDGGTFAVVLPVRPESPPIARGSLLRVYGSPRIPVSQAEGGGTDDTLILEAAWYRHWPHGTYVTTGDAVVMRR